MKKCSRCHVQRELSQFFVSRKTRAKDGLHNVCKPCCREYRRLWGKNSKGRKSIRKTDLKSKYGISVEKYESMFLSQKGRCAICGVHRDSLDRNLSVDHCHKTGSVRGLLCFRCNVALGYFYDRIENLTSAIKYLNDGLVVKPPDLKEGA